MLKDHLSIFYCAHTRIQTLRVMHRKAWQYLNNSTWSSFLNFLIWSHKPNKRGQKNNQPTKIIEKKTNYKYVKTKFNFLVFREKEWIYCLLHNHKAFKVKIQLASLWRLSKYLHPCVHHSFASGPPSNWCLLKSFSCKQCGGTSRKFHPRELLITNDHQCHSFT